MCVGRIGLATDGRALGRPQSFVGLRFEPKAVTDYPPDGVSKTPHESLVCRVQGREYLFIETDGMTEDSAVVLRRALERRVGSPVQRCGRGLQFRQAYPSLCVAILITDGDREEISGVA